MILALVEHADGELDELSLQALTFARGYAAGEPRRRAGRPRRRRGAALGAYGVATVHVAEHDGGYAPLAWARAVAELVERLRPRRSWPPAATAAPRCSRTPPC